MSPYAILGGFALLAAVALGGAHTGRKLERGEWQAKALATAAATQAEIIAAQDHYVRAQKFNEAIARKASEDHAQALSDLDQKYAAARVALRAAGGLRITRAVCADSHDAAASGPGAGGLDEAATSTVALPERVTDDLLSLTKEADELAERLRSLQAWVRSSGAYGE